MYLISGMRHGVMQMMCIDKGHVWFWYTVRPGLKGPPSSRPFRVILIGLRKISRNFSTFHILTSQQFLETVSRFFAQTVRSYVCNIVLHPLLMAYVVEICDNYADLSRKVLLPMYIVHVLCAPRV